VFGFYGHGNESLCSMKMGNILMSQAWRDYCECWIKVFIFVSAGRAGCQ